MAIAGVIVRGAQTRIWSRNRRDLTDRFPDIVRAAEQQLPVGAVVDGELVIPVDGRLSFDALQHRLVTSPAKARQLVARLPASYVAFDLLAVGGVDLRTQRWSARRRRLESIAAWEAPLQLSLVTDDLAEAAEWFEALPGSSGVHATVDPSSIAACRFSTARSLSSPPTRPDMGSCGNEASPRVHSRSPFRSSPHLWHPVGTGAPWASPGLRTRPLLATHARGGTGPRH
jgi:hypothetical protein